MGSHLTLPQTIFLVLAALGCVLLANGESFIVPRATPVQRPVPVVVVAKKALPQHDLRLKQRPRHPAGDRH